MQMNEFTRAFPRHYVWYYKIDGNLLISVVRHYTTIYYYTFGRLARVRTKRRSTCGGWARKIASQFPEQAAAAMMTSRVCSLFLVTAAVAEHNDDDFVADRRRQCLRQADKFFFFYFFISFRVITTGTLLFISVFFFSTLS